MAEPVVPEVRDTTVDAIDEAVAEPASTLPPPPRPDQAAHDRAAELAGGARDQDGVGIPAFARGHALRRSVASWLRRFLSPASRWIRRRSRRGG